MTRSRIPEEVRRLWDATEPAPEEPDDDATGSPDPGTAKAKGPGESGRVNDRFRTLNNFVDFTLRELTRAEIAVWLMLWRDTKPDGLAGTSQADIGRRAGMDVRTVKRTVAGLCRRGLLTVVCRGGLRRGPSTYRVRPLTNGRKK